MELKKFSEIIGRLQSVEIIGEAQILRFTLEKKIEIPKKALKINLSKHIGEKVGVFNGGDIGYRFRVFKT